MAGTLPARRRSVVISGAGDRRDDDIRQQTRILGDVFDNVLLYQDQCQRGRADGEVIALDAATKLLGEHYASFWARHHGLGVVSVAFALVAVTW